MIKDMRFRSMDLSSNGDAISYFMGTQARDFQLEKSYEAAYQDERKAEEDEKSKTLKSGNVLYFKKVIKPTEKELKKHKEFLKTSLKKNFFN